MKNKYNWETTIQFLHLGSELISLVWYTGRLNTWNEKWEKCYIMFPALLLSFSVSFKKPANQRRLVCSHRKVGNAGLAPKKEWQNPNSSAEGQTILVNVRGSAGMNSTSPVDIHDPWSLQAKAFTSSMRPQTPPILKGAEFYAICFSEGALILSSPLLCKTCFVTFDPFCMFWVWSLALGQLSKRKESWSA